MCFAFYAFGGQYFIYIESATTLPDIYIHTRWKMLHHYSISAMMTSFSLNIFNSALLFSNIWWALEYSDMEFWEIYSSYALVL